MPPPDTSPAAVVRYLTRLLTALTIEAGGELRIPLRRIRQVELESSRQMLVEDTDTQKDQLVLRFGTKHSAVYPVEPECPVTQQRPPQPATSAASEIPVPSDPPQPKSHRPLSEADLLRLERNLRARRVSANLQRQRDASQNPLSEISDRNSTG